MPNIFPFIVEILMHGLLFSIPTVLIRLWLIRAGVVRPGLVSSLMVVWTLVIIKRVWFRDILFWEEGIAIILVSTLKDWDIWYTTQKGRWWWKKEEK